MIYIRADANSNIGSGHIMRTLSIAKMLKAMGQQVTYVTADSNPVAILQNNDFPVMILNSNYRDLEEELPKWSDLIKSSERSLILVDSYFITDRYLSELRKLGELILMDDFGTHGYSADVVINYNIYAKELPYDRLYPQDTMRLLGCSYVPLREEFAGGEQRALRNQRERNEEKAQSNCCDMMNVLITAGGADEFNIAGALIRRLESEPVFTSLLLQVVVGPLNKNYRQLVQMSEANPHIIVHHNVSDMAALMQNCDAAISAGGSTLYELCACGVPTVSFSFADNQLQGVRGFSERNIISYAGDMRVKPEETLEKVVQKLTELYSDAELRGKLSMKMQELVDGFGARRIAEKLLMIL